MRVLHRVLFFLPLLFTLSVSGAPNIFTFRMLGEPETLDWNRAHTPIETYILSNLMEGLTVFDEKMKPAPALAMDWSISADGLSYEFHLRKGVRWSDGVPLKAQDFVYSWKRLLSPTTAAAYAYLLFDIVGAEDYYHGKLADFSRVGVKAINERTLRVTLSHVVPYWLDIPTFWVTFPLREDVVAKFGDHWTEPGKMVTVGPFVLKSHEIDQRITLKANSSYYGSRGNVDEAVALIVNDGVTALNLYDSGQLDFMTDLPTFDLRRLASRPDFKAFPYLKTVFLGTVIDKGMMSDPHVRRAVSMAIDRVSIGEILQGKQDVASSFVPRGMTGFSNELGLAYDPKKARAELQLSSHPAGGTVEMVLPNTEKSRVVGEFIQGQLKKNLGIDVALQGFDNKTFRAQVDLRTFPLFLLSWSADYPDPDNFLSIFLSDAGNNRTHWKSSAYDDAIVKARSIMNAKTRERLYSSAQKLLLNDAAVIPLYYEPQIALLKARVQNLKLNPLNSLSLKQVTLSPK